jgi:hypothetical protein
MIGHIVNLHLGRQKNIKKIDPKERQVILSQKEKTLTEKLNGSGKKDEFKTTKKMLRSNTYQNPKRSMGHSGLRVYSMTNSQKDCSIEFLKSRNNSGNLKEKAELETLVDLEVDPSQVNKKRISLLVNIENILEDSLDANEQYLIEKLEKELEHKSKKIIRKFIKQFSVKKREREEYIHDLEHTIFSKAKMAIAFIITKERENFFNLMRGSNENGKESLDKELFDYWKKMYWLYDDLQDDPESIILKKGFVNELFKFPLFKTEIVFLLKYFFKVF